MRWPASEAAERTGGMAGTAMAAAVRRSGRAATGWRAAEAGGATGITIERY